MEAASDTLALVRQIILAVMMLAAEIPTPAAVIHVAKIPIHANAVVAVVVSAAAAEVSAPVEDTVSVLTALSEPPDIDSLELKPFALMECEIFFLSLFTA